MPRANHSVMISLAAASALLALGAGCERPSEGKAGSSGTAGVPVARVEVVRPERHTVRRAVAEPGQLVALETTPIHAKISGYVKSWSVNIGAEVKKGQVLAELSVPETQAELKQKQAAIEHAEARRAQARAAVEVAEANLAGAEAKLNEVRAGVNRAEADLTRWKSEAGRVSQLVSERAVTGSLLDETRSKLHSAESSREEVRAQVKTAEVARIQSRAALDQARSDVVAATAAIDVAKEDAHRVEAMLAYTRIEAPYDGIITRRTIETGQLTKPGADTAPLFVVSRSDIVTIIVDVPETYATEINPGDRVQVKLQAAKVKLIDTKVTRTSWSLDPKSRTIRVEIDIPNPQAQLRPGLYAYATIAAEEHPDVLTIPSTAVVTDQDQRFCVVIVDGKAVRRPLEVGLSDGTRTEVVSGLKEGEQVVKANAASLSDGQTVEPVTPPPAGAKP